MSTKTIPLNLEDKLPTVISTATILNTFVRGAKRAVAELGPEYFSVISKDFVSSILSVYRSEAKPSIVDNLSPVEVSYNQDSSVWSLKLESYDLGNKKKVEKYASIFGDLPICFIFNTEAEAVEYIDKLESNVVELIKTKATAEVQSTIEENTDG